MHGQHMGEYKQELETKYLYHEQLIRVAWRQGSKLCAQLACKGQARALGSPCESMEHHMVSFHGAGILYQYLF